MFIKSFLNRKRLLRIGVGALAVGAFFVATDNTFAQETAPSDELAFAIDNMFLFIAAVLVLFMQAGFALVEAGFNSGKNTVNILFKNLMDLSIGALIFFIVGYGLMYGGEPGAFFGFGQFGISEWDGTIGSGVLHPQVDFFFQVAFAATAATIVSGAVAGRMQFKSYLIYSAVLTGFIYPISGFWKWGGGWLDTLGFYDFAGSLVVHAVGGFAGLAGAIVLGPRIGRFNKDGSANAMPGHNITAATLGVFILMVGWFGFNPGSQLLISTGVDTVAVVLIATNTLLAACAGAVLAMVLSVFVIGKPDISFSLNGLLAGLVGITANCDSVTNLEAVVIGAVAGGLVVGGMVFLEKVRVDDPVGAWPVHGLCGIWGGLATSIFGGYPFGVQLLGSLVIPLWAFVTMGALFLILKAAGILRVSENEELEGLDVTEHGTVNYPEFAQPVTTIE